jgi:hypothetical protein
MYTDHLAEIEHALTGRFSDDLRLQGTAQKLAEMTVSLAVDSHDLRAALEAGVTDPSLMRLMADRGYFCASRRLALRKLSEELQPGITWAHSMSIPKDVTLQDFETRFDLSDSH